MGATSRSPLEARLRRFDDVLEIGIGRHTRLARRLVDHDVGVTAVDVDPIATPAGVRFVRGDVRDLAPREVAPVDAVYGRNLPPELHAPGSALAGDLDAEFLFTTLGDDPVLVSAQRLGDPPAVVNRVPADRPEEV